jgi:hypothetical protein
MTSRAIIIEQLLSSTNLPSGHSRFGGEENGNGHYCGRCHHGGGGSCRQPSGLVFFLCQRSAIILQDQRVQCPRRNAKEQPDGPERRRTDPHRAKPMFAFRRVGDCLLIDQSQIIREWIWVRIWYCSTPLVVLAEAISFLFGTSWMVGMKSD